MERIRLETAKGHSGKRCIDIARRWPTAMPIMRRSIGITDASSLENRFADVARSLIHPLCQRGRPLRALNAACFATGKHDHRLRLHRQ